MRVRAFVCVNVYAYTCIYGFSHRIDKESLNPLAEKLTLHIIYRSARLTAQRRDHGCETGRRKSILLFC